MIFAARSEPKAIVLVGTESLSMTCLMKRVRGYRIAVLPSKELESPLVFDLWSLITRENYEQTIMKITPP